MQAYHNDPAIKAKYVTRIKHHMALDNLIKGSYWIKRSYWLKGGSKGCAIGCILNGKKEDSITWHLEYERQLNIPQAIGGLVDGIFERLPLERSKIWPLESLEAIAVGADLSNIWSKLVVWLLVDEKYGVIKYIKCKELIACTQRIADLYRKDELPSESTWDQNSGPALIFKNCDGEIYAAALTIYICASAAYLPLRELEEWEISQHAKDVVYTFSRLPSEDRIIALADKLLELLSMATGDASALTHLTIHSGAETPVFGAAMIGYFS